VLHAGRAYYSRLLEAGVRLHELQGTVLHAKTGVIDGVLSTIGSSNLDFRSFEGNNEVNAVVLGEDFGSAMHDLFRQDLAASREITRADWSDRTIVQRMKETAARLLERWW
jgi:cardiolipin synthase